MNKAEEYFYNALQYEQNGNYINAIQYYNKSIELQPKENAYLRLAAVYRIIRDYNNALSNFKKALNINNDSVYANMGIGCVYNDNGYYHKAIEYFNNAIRLIKDKGIEDEHKNLQNAYYNLGLSYFLLGEYNKSIENFDEALKLNEEDYETYNDKGNAYYKQGYFDKAIESYKKALSINPNFENAKYNLERTKNALKEI